MGKTTSIEWADSTFNPWFGCTKISPACDKCYAERKTHGKGWGNQPRIRTAPGYWRQPLYWNADAPRFQREHGHRQRVFCSHLSDVFDNQVPDEWRADLFKLIRNTPNLDWPFLTKRPQNVIKMLPPDWGDGYANVWLGISAENEHYYRQRWPILAAIPAVTRLISYEPALGPLGPVDIGVGVVPDWIIVGGESGNNPRMMDPQWARDVRDQCRRPGIAFFMKQMTAKAPIPADLMVREFPANPLRGPPGGAVTPLLEQQFHSDPIALFKLRAEQHAARHLRGEISLHAAVDELQAAAVHDGVIDLIGQDGVQAIMSAAFDDGRVTFLRRAAQ
jgi:protein gp37